VKLETFSVRRKERQRVDAAARKPESTSTLTASAWARERLGFDADAAQMRVLDAPGKRGILNCTRQWGKSTVAAAKALHRAYTEAECLVVVVSPTARQSGEFVFKVEQFAKRLEVKPKGDGRNEISLVLPNGSRIVGLPGTEATVRGFSKVALLLIDEAARVRDEMYRAVRPMLAASNGDLWLMSTPHGMCGFFYEAWQEGGPAWERVRVTAAECSRIRPEFLEEEMRALGDRTFRQEYCCEFGAMEDYVFDPELIKAAFSDDVKPFNLPGFKPRTEPR
jgi:hypothetical protein